MVLLTGVVHLVELHFMVNDGEWVCSQPLRHLGHDSIKRTMLVPNVGALADFIRITSMRPIG